MVGSEFDLEGECRKLVEDVHKGRLAKWTYPGKRGVPDRILLLPDCPVVFIEFKKHDVSTELKGAQRRWRRWLLRNGFRHFAINNINDFVQVVDDLITERET